MKTWREAIHDGAISGSYASGVSTAALGITSKKETGSHFAATNAISHWLWGEKAAHQDSMSARYTLLGYTIHHASACLWATVYEKVFGREAEKKQYNNAMLGGLAVAGLACFVDYKLTPERLKPGYEKRLSKKSLTFVYAAFGLALAIRGLASSKD